MRFWLKPKIMHAAGLILLIIGILTVSMTERPDTAALFAGFTVAFGGYFLCVKFTPDNLSKTALAVALLVRLWLWTSPPALSDDYHRFAWDGRLVLAGISPYAALPSELSATGQTNDIPDSEILLSRMNSPDYHSPYPPLAQVFFATSALLGKGSAESELLWMRIILLLADLGIIWLLIRLLTAYQMPLNRVLLYALNPLVVVETAANVHFEVLWLLLVLAVLYFLKKPSGKASGILLSAGALVKLTPLMFGPMVLKHLAPRERWTFLIFGALTVILISSPFYFLSGGNHMAVSVGLWFRTFEFNAGLYYLLRWAISGLIGYNPIAVLGPALSILAGLIILWISFSSRFQSYPTQRLMIMILSVFLLTSTTVHPWYLIPLVGLAVLDRLLYPVVWSAVAWLSYAHYSGGGFEENYLLIAVEYAILLIAMARDLSRKKENPTEIS
jgi:alpha-1,6-mannosyltransferase